LANLAKSAATRSFHQFMKMRSVNVLSLLFNFFRVFLKLNFLGAKVFAIIVGLSMTSPDLETLMDGYATYNLYLGKNFSTQKKANV
jgi:hypothetical protein